MRPSAVYRHPVDWPAAAGSPCPAPRGACACRAPSRSRRLRPAGDRQAAAVRAVGQRVDAVVVGARAGAGPRLDDCLPRRVRASLKTRSPNSSPAASVRSSGLSAMLKNALAAAADHADRGRALHQRGEEVAARLDGVVERDALPGQQQRAVQLALDQRARAEPLRIGRARPVRAVPRWSSAKRPATTASTSSAATPARTIRRRRTDRSLAAWLSCRNARSVALSSTSCAADQSSAAASRAPR